jgi:hypothetical protein
MYVSLTLDEVAHVIDLLRNDKAEQSTQLAETLANRKEEQEVQAQRNDRIIEMARDQHQVFGETEIDDGALVSEGDDNGAYVQSWIWVDFSDTELDKELEAEELTDD